MKLSGKSVKQNNVKIADYYALRPKQIWKDFKQESPAFWWFCIYFFFEYVRPQGLYPVIDILPYAQISLSLACVFALADRNIKWVSNSGNALIILFFIVILISSVFAFHPATSFGHMKPIINWLILYFLMITVVNSEKRFIIFLLLFFLVHFKMSQFGFRHFITQGYSSWGVSGSPGWFRNAGDLGIGMIIFVSLSATFVLALKDYWGRYKTLFLYLLPLTGLVTIIATSSRGAQLGIVATGIWFLLKSNNGIKGLIGFLLLGLAFYALLPERMLEEFGSVGTDNTSQARLALWSYGLEVVRDFPVLGVGYFNWSDYCWWVNPYGIPGTFRESCMVAHNTYITAGAEIGIVGLILYVMLMLFILRLNARTRANAIQSNNKFILFTAHGLDGGLIGFMVASIFFSVLFYPMLYVQLAMTVTLYVISTKQTKEDSVATSKRTL